MAILPSLSSDEYHGYHDVCSNSQLTIINKSPASLKYYLDKGPETLTDITLLGLALHKKALEEETFYDEYAVALDNKKPQKQNPKQLHFDGYPEELGQHVLTKYQYFQVCNMQQALLQHKISRHLLWDLPGRNELSIFQTDPVTKKETRIRIDRFLDNGYLLDIKTCDKADAKNFGKSIANFRYHVQAAFYLDNAEWEGLKPQKFIFIAVERHSPYLVAVYVVDELAIQRGREIYRRDLNLYAECVNNNNWPGYGEDRITKISLPGWAFKD